MIFYYHKYMIGEFENLNISIKNKGNPVGMNFKMKSFSSIFYSALGVWKKAHTHNFVMLESRVLQLFEHVLKNEFIKHTDMFSPG